MIKFHVYRKWKQIVWVPSLRLVLVQEYYNSCWHKLSSSLVLVQNPGQRFLNYGTFIFKCDSIWIKGRIVSEILRFVLIAVKMMDLDRSWQGMNTYCVRNSSVLLGLFKSGILMSPFKMYIPISTFICPGLALFIFK